MLSAPKIPTFTIVTPSYNSAAFINSTITSVVSQSGQFRLRYHVQDGGSNDGTAEELQRWSDRLGSGQFPTCCNAVDFSYSVATDRGMYDAIRNGFTICGLGPSGYMTWINSDDLLMPGSLACVAQLFRTFPDIQLMGGIPSQIDEDGVPTRIHALQIYPRTTLAVGLHDGRHLSFVMQEGTFWKNELWLKTGGVRTDFRLAGDFDLWRRFAVETAYASVDTILAAHRRRPGQLSADLSDYYSELDASLTPQLAARDQEWERYQRWRARSASDRELLYTGTCLSCETGQWKREERSLPSLFNTTMYASDGCTHRSVPGEYVSGFSVENGAYPHINVPLGSCWLQECVAILRFEALAAGRHRLRIRTRSFGDHAVLTAKHGVHLIFEGRLPVTFHERDCEISGEADFYKGANNVSLFLEAPGLDRRPHILIVTAEATPIG